MRRVATRALICGLADAAVVAVLLVVLIAVFSADFVLWFRSNPDLTLGFLLPMAVFAGVWGFFNARDQVLEVTSRAGSPFGGAVAAASASLISQVFGFVQFAYAAGSIYPTPGEATTGEWIQYGFAAVFFALVVGVIGALFALGLTAMNAALLRRLPA